MERLEEIEIILNHLIAEVKNCANNSEVEFPNTIIRNGKLIEKYREEYRELFTKQSSYGQKMD